VGEGVVADGLRREGADGIGEAALGGEDVLLELLDAGRGGGRGQ
jgi:hypothetical protein